MINKAIEFKKLMDKMRTEWFIFDSGLPIPNNIKRIKNICKQISELDVSENDFKNTKFTINDFMKV